MKTDKNNSRREIQTYPHNRKPSFLLDFSTDAFFLIPFPIFWFILILINFKFFNTKTPCPLICFSFRWVNCSTRSQVLARFYITQTVPCLSLRLLPFPYLLLPNSQYTKNNETMLNLFLFEYFVLLYQKHWQ